MNNFFKKLMLQKYKLSDLEEKVFDLMIEKQDEIVDSTLTEFAEKMFVSTATVSRTCKKIGYNGYQEFQYAYNQFKQSNESLLEDYTGTNEYVNKVIQDMYDNIHSFKEEKISQIVDLLIMSDFVEIFGIGRTYPVCREGATKLNFAGRIANARSDWDEQRAVAKYLKETDLAILVSISGVTPEILECAKILKGNNVKIVSFVGTKASTLIALSDLFMQIDITPAYINQVDMSSHFLFSILFDTLAISYMEERLGGKHTN